MNRWKLLGFVVALFISWLIVRGVTAQEARRDLRLLAWSLGGTFWIGATPGEVVTLGNGSVRQLTTLWLLPADGTTPRLLAEGFDVALSLDRRRVTFSRFDALDQDRVWQIDLQIGNLSPWSGPPDRPAQSRSAGIPAGRAFWSPDGQKRVILVNHFFQAQLWLVDGDAPPQLVLAGQGELFSDLAWRPDGDAVAFIRTPLGSSTDRASELWRLDLGGGAPLRLSQNNVVDQSPLWSPDGSSLAVVRNGAVVIVPAGELQIETFEVVSQPPGVQSSPQTQLTPPAEIRVIHDERNMCRDVDVEVGQIDTIPFEEYVKRVVPHEVFPSWPAETLKAQAVAARTYSWYFINQNPAAPYHVTDWTNFQVMCDSTLPSTDQAVDDTQGEYLAFDGQPIIAFFSAENASPTRNHPALEYIQAVDDPVSFGQTRRGHGYGMGQWGAQRWADRHNWSYQAILRHYYSGVTLEEGAAVVDTAPPNVAIVAPWSNHYLTADHLWIMANTSDDGGTITQTNIYLSTPLTTTHLFSDTGPARPEGYLLDLSARPDQVLLTNSLVLTAEAFDAVGRRGVSPPVVIGLDRVDPSGFFTNTAVPGGTVIFTGSVVLPTTFSGSDATSGITGVSLGDANWRVEGEAFIPQEGGGTLQNHIIADPDALNGSALQMSVAIQAPGYWYNRQENWPPGGQLYRAYFRLKVSDNTITGEVASLTVIDTVSGDLIGLHRLPGIDFRVVGAYQEFHVDFDGGDAGNRALEFRVQFNDLVDVTFDRMVVLEYPRDYTPNPPLSYKNQRLKLVDAAGNVSQDLLLFFASLGNEVYLPLITK